jgi:hypothetical protein
MKKIISILIATFLISSIYASDISKILYFNAQISVSPDSLNFTLPRGLSSAQDLMVANVGNESLFVNISEQQITKNSLLTREIQDNFLENSEKVVVITDTSGDSEDPAIDVLSIEIDRSSGPFGITTSFAITFASPPDTGTFGIISIDIDQELGTGIFPAPFGYNLPVYDLGSEIEIIFDVGNNLIDTLGFGPIAVALSAADSSFIGLAQIQTQGNTASAVFSPFFGGNLFDESFNIAATCLSFDDLAYPDFAPDYGHGVFGTEIPISWLSALPQSFSLAPAESLVIPVQFVSVNEPGNYSANLQFSSNDTINPVESVHVDFIILNSLEPDINLPVTVFNDTITDASNSTRFFAVENNGAGELFYFLSDSLPPGQDWLKLTATMGTIISGSSTLIPYNYNKSNIIPGNNYSGIITIISNDPDERFFSIQINVHYIDPNNIIENENIPLTTELKQNYPNPFNPETQIEYTLAQSGFVKLSIYNLLGQKVIELVNGQQSAGKFCITWNGTNTFGQQVASGVYYYQLNTENGFAKTKKFLLLR